MHKIAGYSFFEKIGLPHIMYWYLLQALHYYIYILKDIPIFLSYCILIYLLVFSKWIFDGPVEDPDYAPLPEERPGGFAWGEGERLGRPENEDEAAQ